ncbi:MAG: hypothetical protein JSS93_04160 [Bacteroidetes bacterium]|nr:hypothetical protein [Bacteroidota bacterium]MBS1981695.1 hypothetical protein [Bacteroidota bacterium]
MALGFPFGFRVAASEPLDNKYGPYLSVTAALEAVASGERHIGLTINIGGIEYWWKDATTDAGLVVKATTESRIVKLNTTLPNISLDFFGSAEVTFIELASISANKSWQLVNTTNARKFSVLFAIELAPPNTCVQTFPENFIMDNPWWDKANKSWTAYQDGFYKATGIFDGSRWWMDIDGAYG